MAVPRRLLLAGSMATGSAALALYAGRRGLGISPDSVEYLGVARNLLDGKGLTVPFGAVTEEPFVGAPMTSFPPLYPVLLAVGGAGLWWARVLAVLAAATTAACTTLVARRFTERSSTAASSVALLFAPDFVRVHAQAWSEPVLLALIAVGTLALVAHLDRPRRATWLTLLACCALAPMARYPGIVFVAAVGIVVTRRRGPREGLALAGAGTVPLAAWLAYGAAAVSDPGSSSRTLGWHGLPMGDLLSQAAETVGRYWLSGLGSGYSLLVVALLLACFRPRRHELVFYAALLVVGSVVLLLATRALLDRTQVLDSRLLAPAHLGAVLALPLLLRSRRRWQAAALAVAALVVVGGSVRWSTRFADSPSRQYASSAWARSPTLQAVERLPRGTVLYSNGPEAVWWATERPVALVPVKRGLRNGAPQPWRSRVAAIPDGAVVVLLDHIVRDSVPTAAELGAVRPLRLLARLDDGAVYEAAL